MKKILKSLLLLISIGVMLSGCSNQASEDKTVNVNQTKTESNTSVINSDTEIVITINNLQFNLGKPFGEVALNTLDSKSLSILRNSIYAKYGYIFNSKEYSEYFSQFSWYKPTSKDVKDKLNNIDTQNIDKISSLEKAKQVEIKSSKNITDLSNDEEGNILFNFDNKKEKLFISREELNEEGNKPVRITLKILTSEEVFESSWNDGIFIYVADFDESDNDKDVCIVETGTDIECRTHIYKFDGLKLSYYCVVNHFGDEIRYDGKGKIYFWYDTDDKVVFNNCFDYKTKQSSILTNEDLKQLLNKVK